MCAAIETVITCLAWEGRTKIATTIFVRPDLVTNKFLGGAGGSPLSLTLAPPTLLRTRKCEDGWTRNTNLLSKTCYGSTLP